MSNLILDRLTIHEFKGINTLYLRFDGANAVISGANATGKTTVYDALLWLLFGKDSQDSANFNVKPLDASGNKIPGTEPEVIAEICFDGKPYTLRKSLKEIWRKPTGQAQQVYDRDEVQASVNDVPMKIDREYAPFINSLIPEQLFRIALHHSYFMRLPWTERRQHLIQISNPDVDKELLADPAYDGISTILEGVKNTDDARKRLMEQRKKLNQELDEIPARVDELQRTATPKAQDELEAAREKKAEMEKQLSDIDAILASGEEARKRIADLYFQKSSLQSRLAARQSALEKEANAEITKAKEKFGLAEATHLSLEREIRILGLTVRDFQGMIESKNARLEELRGEWDKEDTAQFVASNVPNACPACGQSLPKAQVEYTMNRALEQFAVEKERTLRGITIEGDKLKDAIVKHKADLESSQKKLADAQQANQQRIEEMDAMRIIINSPVPAINFSDDAEFRDLQATITQVQSLIDAVGDVKDNGSFLGRKREIQMVLDMQNRILATEDQAKVAQSRITELMGRKATLGQLVATIDGQLDLLARFVSARCGRLEAHINAMFPTIRWQLFNQLKNGGIEDCCTATVSGVPYADLNNAARINAGIEASRVICRAHGIICPCFVDNAESVNNITPPSGQLIALVVSRDPELRLEVSAA